MLSNRSSDDMSALLGDESKPRADNERQHAYATYSKRRVCGVTVNSRMLLLLFLCFMSVIIFYAMGSTDSMANISSLKSSMSSYASSSSSSWKEVQAQKLDYPAIYSGPVTTNPVNETLGFQKIYALNLPHRLDKSDELALAAQVSGIKIDLIATKLTKDLNEAGLPWHEDFTADGPGTIGVWRAHADAWRKIIDDGVTTALIFEDDNDWDLDVKQQLQRLHQPLATLINSIENDGKKRVSTKEDPYLHEDWDVLMLGYCMELPYSAEEQFGPPDVDPNRPPHLLYDDGESIAPRNITSDSINDYMDHYGYPVPGGPTPNPRATFSRPRRLIAKAHFPICLSAYAVSQRGAARLLYHQTRSVIDAVDVRFAVLMQQGLIKGYEVMPPIMDQWKVKDGKFKNSDKDLTSQGDKYTADTDRTLNHNPSIGFTWHVLNSVRENLPKLLAYPQKDTTRS